MTINLAKESTMISDDTAPEMPEFPIVIEDYKNSDCIAIVGHDGASVTISYRMIKDVIKVMKQYSK